MNEILIIDDFTKLEMRVGKVENIGKSVKIKCGDREFNTNLKLNLNKDEKIVIGILGDKLILPVVGKNIPIVPEKDIGIGARIR